MRDATLITGKLSPATKATRVYSANSVDLKAATQNIGDIKNLYAAFQFGEDVASADSFTFEIYESDDNSTFTLAVASAAFGTGYKANDIVTVPFPKTIKRYVKMGCLPASTGTLDAQDVQSWIDFR